MSYDHLNDLSRQIITTIDKLQLPNNPVIVYDVDDTLIDIHGRPIHPIIQTYHYAKSRGIPTAIVTARMGIPSVIEHTKSQLAQYGIHDHLYMYFRPEDRYDQYRFKFMSRKNIHERGHIVVMSIGDQPQDIGHYGGVGFIVPSFS